MSNTYRRRDGKKVKDASGKATDGVIEVSLPKSLTITYAEIEDWQKDNEFIVTGYRRLLYSWRKCIASVFGYLHNETINIHSHLLGALLFAWLLGTFRQVYFVHYDHTTWLDTAVFTIFLSSAVFCMGLSASYHTFHVHSREVARQCHALDYTGIVVLTVGSFFPCIYYGFFCHPKMQALYLTCMSAAGVGAAYIVLNPEYGKASHRVARTSVFVALGLCGVIPVTHGIINIGFRTIMFDMGFIWILASAAFYIVGALLYASRIPERFSPGTFDYFGASHQIFHLCVVLAALSHYACVLTAFDYRHSRTDHCGSL